MTASGREKVISSEKCPERGAHDIEIASPERGQLNAAGYKDQLRRQYGLFGIVGIALTVDNAWAALGSSISVSIRESQKPNSHTLRLTDTYRDTRSQWWATRSHLWSYCGSILLLVHWTESG